MHQSRVVEMIGRMDGDHDGKLSPAELEAVLEARLKDLSLAWNTSSS